MAHFAQAVTANVGHVVRELQAVASLCSLHALPEGKRIFTSLAYLVTRESHPSGRAVHVQQCGCGGNYQERHPGALRFVVKGQTELVALVPATPPKSGSVATIQCGPLKEVKKGLCSSGDGTQLLQAGTGTFSGSLMTSGSFTMMASGGLR